MGKAEKDPRYASSGEATEVKTNYYDRDPYPKYSNTEVEANNSQTVTYQNGTEELSEIKRIRIKAHPDILVSVKRTKDNQDQTVYEQRAVRDLPVIDGWSTIEFRHISADAVLVIEKNQTIQVEYTHTLVGSQTVTTDIDKQAVRFYGSR